MTGYHQFTKSCLCANNRGTNKLIVELKEKSKNSTTRVANTNYNNQSIMFLCLFTYWLTICHRHVLLNKITELGSFSVNINIFMGLKWVNMFSCHCTCPQQLTMVKLNLYVSAISCEIFVCFIPFIFLSFSVVFFLLHYLLAFHYQGWAKIVTSDKLL